MSAVIQAPDRDAWVFPGLAFEDLLRRPAVYLHSPEDLYRIDQANALGIVALHLMTTDQASRVGWAIACAARDVRVEVSAKEHPTSFELLVANVILSIETHLSRLYGAGEQPEGEHRGAT